MKIIKLSGDSIQNKLSLEILKNRGLPHEELDKDFNVIESINKTKVVKVVESSKKKKLTKKINKEIKLHLEKGLELIDLKQSTCSYGDYGFTTVVTLIFE